MFRYFVGLFLLPQVAVAQPPQLNISYTPDSAILPLTSQDEMSAKELGEINKPDLPFEMEAGIRWKFMSIPRSIMSVNFTEEADDGWILPGQDRPDIKALAMGVEFVIKWDTSNLFLYMDYTSSRTQEGYWDDRDEDFTDGSYVVPTDDLSIITVGADYMADIKLVDLSLTDNKFGMSLLLGGGLGISYVRGDVIYWEATQDSPMPSFDKYSNYLTCQDSTAGCPENLEPEAQNIPRVLPMIDIQAAIRFNIMDRTALRIEGGLHNLLYWGGGFDVAF